MGAIIVQSRLALFVRFVRANPDIESNDPVLGRVLVAYLYGPPEDEWPWPTHDVGPGWEIVRDDVG
jgi:hypothetical protein